MNEVWVIAEQRQGKLMNVSLEVLGKAAALAAELKTGLAVVLLGNDVGALARELVYHGAGRVYLGEDPRLRLYQSDYYTYLIAGLIKREQPQIVLLGATSLGRDLASRVAAEVRTGLTAHCVDLSINKECQPPQLVQVVPGWGGNLMVRIACPESRPQMATVNPGVMARPARDPSRQGEIVPIEIGQLPELRVETIEMVEEERSGAALDSARVVVAGGWGLAGMGGFGPVEELAAVVGGAVAGTRPAVDSGWVAPQRMIGQSGITVSPKLFISVGASGAPQFVTGFMGAKVVLAIDQNRNAPIFNVADIGLVGDVRNILPRLIAELKAAELPL